MAIPTHMPDEKLLELVQTAEVQKAIGHAIGVYAATGKHQSVFVRANGATFVVADEDGMVEGADLIFSTEEGLAIEPRESN